MVKMRSLLAFDTPSCVATCSADLTGNEMEKALDIAPYILTITSTAAAVDVEKVTPHTILDDKQGVRDSKPQRRP